VRCVVAAAAVAAAVAAWGLAGGAPGARAQPVTEPPVPPPGRIEVRVGETAERYVGFAVGYRCDDPSLLQIELRTKSEQTNVFVVTGVKEGTTACRVGTDPYRPSVVYEIRVLPRRGRR
jgi:hypothetical protein